MADTALVAEHRRLMDRLGARTRRDVTALLDAVRSADPATATEALLRSVPQVTTVYGELGAHAAADFYDASRARHPGLPRYRAAVAPPAPLPQVEALVRWALGPLWSDQPDLVAAMVRLRGGADRLARQPARQTIIGSAGRDPLGDNGVRYARRPNPGACDWCLELASRGAVYADRSSASSVVGRYGRPRGTRQLGERFHDHCGCAPVAVFTDDDVPDVNRQLQQVWRDHKGPGITHADRRAALAAAAEDIGL